MQHFFSVHQMVFIPQGREKESFGFAGKPIGVVNSRPAFPGGWMAHVIEMLLDGFAAIPAKLRQRRQRDASRRQLAYMNDYLLRDIGLNRDDVRRETTPSHWR
jgi:uncharacterized protein YjiS (DUF1127 family)